MADSQKLEQQVRTLKRVLDNWRMALIPLKSVFLWEQQWHPFAIFGTVSFLFLTIWLMDLSHITTLAVLGLLINFLDFIVPIVCNSIYGPDSWNGLKEKTFEDICKAIVGNFNNMLKKIEALNSLRQNNPIMHLLITTLVLGMLAWVSQEIDNVLLLYIISLGILLAPGIQHSKTFKNALSLFGLTKTEKNE